MKHLLSPLDFSVEELDNLMDIAKDIEANPEKYAHVCEGKKLATLFYEPSTRTRLSSHDQSWRQRSWFLICRFKFCFQGGKCSRYNPCNFLLRRHLCNAPPKRRGCYGCKPARHDSGDQCR